MHVRKKTIYEFIETSEEFGKCITERSIDLAYDMFMTNSPGYCERFLFELAELMIRTQKLENMLDKWRSGKLDFIPLQPIELFEVQLEAMRRYVGILQARAYTEEYIEPRIVLQDK